MGIYLYRSRSGFPQVKYLQVGSRSTCELTRGEPCGRVGCVIVDGGHWKRLGVGVEFERTENDSNESEK